MILFDVEPLQNPDYQNRGIGRYVRNLILNASEHLGREIAIGYNGNLPPPDLDRLSLRSNVVPITRADIKCLQPEWLITCSPFEKSRGKHASIYRGAVPGGKIASLVYDLIPMVFEGDYLGGILDRAEYALGLDGVQNSDIILAISEHTKRDCEAILNKCPPVFGIGTGVDDVFFEGKSKTGVSAVFSRLSREHPSLKRKDIIFTVSGAHRSKNLIGLLEGYADVPVEIRTQHVFVVGGGLPQDAALFFYEEWKRILKKKRRDYSEIIILSHVSDDGIRSLYHNCKLFVYGSLYEGYGLPLAEAVVSGAVSIGSDRTSMKEILSPPFRFDPTSAQSIADAISVALKDDEFRSAAIKDSSERRDKFRWAGVVDALGQALLTQGCGIKNSLASVDDKQTIATKEKSVAFVGPLLPDRTGIASYNSSLVGPLTVDSGVCWYSTSGHAPILGQSSRIVPFENYMYDWQTVESNVYIVGNSYHHITAVEALQDRPGIVWLHDVVLKGLAWDYANWLSPNNPWARINEWSKGYGTSTGLPISSMEELQRSPYLFVRPLLAHAKSFIVHSEHAKDLLVAELGGRADGRPVMVVPHAVPSHTGAIDGRSACAGDEVRVGMVGFMAPIRGAERTIEAAAMLSKDGVYVELRIVGSCSDEYFGALKQYAQSFGLNISRTGYLSEQDFINEVAALDVVVQLRLRSNGESSGTVAHAIGLKVPVVTNIPSVSEFWAGSVECLGASIDVTSVYEAIKRAVSPERIELYAKGRERILKTMSFSAVAERIVACARA